MTLSRLKRIPQALPYRIRAARRYMTLAWIKRIPTALPRRIRAAKRRYVQPDAGIDGEQLRRLIGLEDEDAAFFPPSFINSLIDSTVGGKEDVAYFLRHLAHAFIQAGQVDRCTKYYEKAFALRPDMLLGSLILQSKLISPTVTEEELCAASIRWAERWCPAQRQRNVLTNIPDPERRLKIGHVCHFFHNSVAESIIQPFIRAYNRTNLEIYCYSDAPPHEVKPHVRAIADHWRDTHDMDDDAFSRQVMSDGIDVLLENNGHCIVNRFAAFTHRLAPIQINSYNQASTCGVPEIDYLFVDGSKAGPLDQKCFTEEIYPLPTIYGTLVPPDNLFPAVTPPPCLKNGYITFGSFGASHKINEVTIDLWCAVLKHVPNSRLFMKAAALSHWPYPDIYRRYFRQRGIDESRIMLEGWSEHRDMLKRYAEVDIALDSYPHNAGTTTGEAMWMGIPVVSLYGPRLCARTSRAIIANMGRPEWVGDSPAAFTRIAASLAKDPARLAEIRRTQREHIRGNPLYQPKIFARDLENAYRDMWRRWCKQRKNQQANAA